MNHDNSWKIKLKDNVYIQGKDLYIFRNLNQGTQILKKDGIIETFPENSVIPPEPFMHLDIGMLQPLSDALAENGIKPQKGFLEGKLESTEKHLKDMRALVFKKK